MELIAANPHIDAALLDMELDGEMSDRVVDALQKRGVPFIFVTGHDKEVLKNIRLRL